MRKRELPWFGVVAGAVAGLVVQSSAFPLEVSAAGIAGSATVLEELRVAPLPQGLNDPPDYSKDVAPILQGACVRCHIEGAVGPMPLTTYEEVRLFAPLIKDRVVKRIMPPYHVDPTIGIQAYKNDIRLTKEDINTIVQWVDAGTPEGDPADLPPPVEWPAWGEWQLEAELGPPDLVLTTDPITVRAIGQDMWPSQVIEWEGFPTERFIRADEVKNTVKARSYLHHLVVSHTQPETGRSSQRWSSMGAGKRWDRYSDDVGVLVPPGPARIRYSLHYFPRGEAIVDTVQVGLWFYPEGHKPELTATGEERYLVNQFESGQPRGRDILIPPHGSLTISRTIVLDQPLVIHTFVPHMHTQGIGMSLEAILPGRLPDGWGVDGNVREVLTAVNNYDHNWQNAYVYEENSRPLLPKGTALVLHSHFDNSVNNPLIVDPDQWVTFGGRSIDAMSNARMSVTNLTEEQYEKMVKQRVQLAKAQMAEPRDQQITIWLAPGIQEELDTVGGG